MLPLQFPDKYEESVDGMVEIIPFHTDFIQWMRFEELITDSTIPEDMLPITALRMIFPEKLPRDVHSAMLFMLWFYRCGKPVPLDEEGHGSSVMLTSHRAYSYEHDFDYIAAAFMEKYGIDLWTTHMHWWKFHALFMGLHDCRFTDICRYRTEDITEDTPEYKREFLEKMQQAHRLPVSANELRRIEAARRYLEG